MKKYGILAYPAKHSVSPDMQNAAFQALGIDAEYGTFDVAPKDLGQFMQEQLRAKTIAGLSVSLPYKESVIPFLDSVSEDASKIGAVNTILNDDGQLRGFNTDFGGSNRALIESYGDLKGKQVLVIGAGGAARAVIYGLMKEGANILVMNRSKEKAQALAIQFAEMFESEIHAVDFGDMLGGDILIHTTSIWTKMDFETEDLPYFVYPDFLENFNFVMDIAYPPLKTPLLEGCEDSGVEFIGADRMLLFQGVEQFEIWTGEKAPLTKMEEALKKRLN